MKALIKKTIPAALFFVCFTLTAQEQIFSTVKDATFALTAIVQTTNGGTSKVRIANKDVLAALNDTGNFNFGPDAKLLLRSINGGLPYFVVRESISNEVTTTDVSDTLVLVEPDDAVHGPNQTLNWGIWNYTLLEGGGTDFTFWGFTTLQSGAIPTGNGGDLLRTVKLESIGSGPGHVEGGSAQFSGKVSAKNARLDL
jgi:hypothetical protein